jgi:hypothetical protein
MGRFSAALQHDICVTQGALESDNIASVVLAAELKTRA